MATSLESVCVCVSGRICVPVTVGVRVCVGFFYIIYFVRFVLFCIETSLFSIVTHFDMTDRLLENICLHP